MKKNETGKKRKGKKGKDCCVEVRAEPLCMTRRSCMCSNAAHSWTKYFHIVFSGIRRFCFLKCYKIRTSSSSLRQYNLVRKGCQQTYIRKASRDGNKKRKDKRMRGCGCGITLIIRDKSPASANSRTMCSCILNIPPPKKNDVWNARVCKMKQ